MIFSGPNHQRKGGHNNIEDNIIIGTDDEDDR